MERPRASALVVHGGYSVVVVRAGRESTIRVGGSSTTCYVGLVDPAAIAAVPYLDFVTGYGGAAYSIASQRYPIELD